MDSTFDFVQRDADIQEDAPVEKAVQEGAADTKDPQKESAPKGLVPVVSIRGARKSFDGVEVLRDVSLEVMPGEVLAIIGASGGGKSTLLRCMSLLERLDAGELSYGELQLTRDVAGKAVYAEPRVLQEAKLRFGMVFQGYNLFPHFSVMRNICDAPQVVQGRDKSEVEAQARSLITKMGLEGCEDKVPNQLSGGQQQRVAIARALAMNPQVLYFDEPTSALDPELTQEVLGVIRELAAEDITMVIVTHEMRFARDVADRIIFMDEGSIVEQGSPAELIDNPREARTRAFLAQGGA